jgi:hypothetical protein
MDMQMVAVLAACLLGVSGCGTTAPHLGNENGTSQIGKPCSPSFARLYRKSEPVHDEVEVRYAAPGSVVIETFDERLRLVATRSESLAPPVDTAFDTFAIPLVKGTVVRAARLTITTAAGRRSCVVEDNI